MTEKELQDFIVKEVRNYVASGAARPYVMLDKEVPHIKIPKPIPLCDDGVVLKV